MKRPLIFARYGRAFHAVIENAEDLARLDQLDLTHWVAVSAPVDTLDADPVFLSLVDADQDGRLRQFEVAEAIDWVLVRLTDHAGLNAGSKTLELAAIAVHDEEGQRLHGLADALHLELGKAPTDRTVTLAEVRALIATLEQQAVSGSGVVVPGPGQAEAVQRLLGEVVAVTGGAPHPGGEAGVDEALFETFVVEAAAWAEWWRAREDPAVMPFGAETDALWAAVETVYAKIEQYFVQCDAVRLDPALGASFRLPAKEFRAVANAAAGSIADALADAPLATPDPSRVLPLDGPINPRFERALRAFRRGPLTVLRGEVGPAKSANPTPAAHLPALEWTQVKARFAAHRKWREAAVAPHIAALGLPRVQAILSGEELVATREIIADSTLISDRIDAFRALEALVLYQANILRLANNYVSFPEVYQHERRALFDTGTLIIDGRRLNLVVRVRQRERHVAIAQSSNIYVLYCAVSAPGVEPYEVAATVTHGGHGNLALGKRGLFITAAGKQLDAIVVQIVDNPISLGEAIVQPFVRLGNAITGKIESIAADAEKRLDGQSGGVVTQVAEPKAGSAGMIAGGGIAVAAMSSSAAYITKTLADMTWIKMLWGLGAAAAAVAIPATIAALIKLNRRDLSALLEGSGWAINARMRITWRLARFFTERPRIPLTPLGFLWSIWRWWGSALLLMAAFYVWWFWSR